MKSVVQGTHLRIWELTKTFGSKPVLQGVDLEVAPGEFVALVGRSGESSPEGGFPAVGNWRTRRAAARVHCCV